MRSSSSAVVPLVVLLVASRALLSRAAPSSAQPTPAPQCTWLPDPGPCRAFFRRYYYNNQTHTCQVFVHGGCDGRVPFRTSQQCQAAHCDALTDSTTPLISSHSLHQMLALNPRLRLIQLHAPTVIV
ncbi:Isoinhibitor K [Gracilariopsis chorda]|uniref:Isoinhibitor K n=1 Tax=Gracilariopsis chorda TaxID=448386 RepID=A0A2V3J2F9_9FLOR|nr:Isoinhibitor K [Gracilariopsis chorda]|eukprot:PXF48564.1 Isoinhibitor K [Gracilariopsis chorda]